MQGKWRIGLALVSGAIVAVAAGLHGWRTHNISTVQHGFDEALEHGCFTCHGPGGTHGVNNPGSRWKTVPSWTGGTYMMFVHNEQDIREYILDGAPARTRSDKEWKADQAKSLIHMPAFRDQIGAEELDALVSCFKAVSEFDDISDDTAAAGRDEASALGCFQCHGPEGRGCMPNPGSLKGYIPSWDGKDFPDLVQNDMELKEWVLNGVAKRLTENRVAVFFMQRQKIQMPAYQGNISDAQLEKLAAYIHWLRAEPERKSDSKNTTNKQATAGPT